MGGPKKREKGILTICQGFCQYRDVYISYENFFFFQDRLLEHLDHEETEWPADVEDEVRNEFNKSTLKVDIRRGCSFNFSVQILNQDVIYMMPLLYPGKKNYE